MTNGHCPSWAPEWYTGCTATGLGQVSRRQGVDVRLGSRPHTSPMFVTNSAVNSHLSADPTASQGTPPPPPASRVGTGSELRRRASELSHTWKPVGGVSFSSTHVVCKPGSFILSLVLLWKHPSPISQLTLSPSSPELCILFPSFKDCPE